MTIGFNLNSRIFVKILRKCLGLATSMTLNFDLIPYRPKFVTLKYHENSEFRANFEIQAKSESSVLGGQQLITG